jgi:hypothetical protein
MNTTAVSAPLGLVIPLQPVSAAPAPTAYERASAGASRIHAYRKTLNGPRALCFAGLPVTWLGGRFDPLDPDSCEECALRTAR